jgi:alpha-1,3-rhamnosyl/mannosyltransferase
MNLLWARTGRVGGSEDYFARQLLGLREIDHEFDVTAYVLPGFEAAHPELAGARFDTAPLSGQQRPVRVAMEHTWLSVASRRRGERLMHHGGGSVPAGGINPAVLTIHDLQWHEYPKYVKPLKLRYLRWSTPRSVRRARVITVPTEFVKRTVVEAYGVDPDIVVPVRHGMEPHLGAGATDEETLRRKYGLGTGPIVVYPAMTHPHKRHDFLVDLVAAAWGDVTLVLTGGEGAAESALRSRIEERRVVTRVVRTGRVPTADRDGLIKMALAVAFPSEYEGFGAPALEAMALGAPLVASNCGSLPEVVGNAGIVLPLEADAWADALQRVSTQRDALIAAGHRRVAEFSTRLSAEDLLGAYRLALS